MADPRVAQPRLLEQAPLPSNKTRFTEPRQLWSGALKPHNESVPPEKPTTLIWERLAADTWSSAAGFIKLEEPTNTWCAHLYRNTRVGRGWTETKQGFTTADKAKRWIEREAED